MKFPKIRNFLDTTLLRLKRTPRPQQVMDVDPLADMPSLWVYEYPYDLNRRLKVTDDWKSIPDGLLVWEYRPVATPKKMTVTISRKLEDELS